MPTDPLFSLNGKTAMITGGGSGIGRAIAQALSQAGASIVLVGRRREALVEALADRNGIALPDDLSDPECPERLLSKCKDHGREPDILVNAAGINLRHHADDVTRESWDATLQLNLSTPFFWPNSWCHICARKSGGGSSTSRLCKAVGPLPMALPMVLPKVALHN